MASITVRNVPDEVHRALRVRAAQSGCSAEAMKFPGIQIDELNDLHEVAT